MKIEITLRDPEARSVLFYLRARYGSKAGLPALAKQAIRDVAAGQAKKQLEDTK